MAIKLMPVYPISFSIPSSKIVDAIPHKTRLLAHIIPGNTNTYIYNSETDYYKGYQESWFALTCKKGGWDCMRHYEIIANGCIPLFLDLPQCPPNTMTTFPKELVTQSNMLYFQILETGFTSDHEDQCRCIINKLLQIARERMTCKATAQYILNTVSPDIPVKSILYLSGHTGPDYLRCLTLTGFKELLGSRCHDYPRISHIYADCIPDNTMWGKGITYTGNVALDLYDDSRNDTVIFDITNHKYDLIIYGSGHRGMPFIDIVQNHYSPNEVVVLCGEDCDRNIHYSKHCCAFINAPMHVFVREL